MAWAVKYRTEFYDLLGKAWKVDILEDAFAGTITTLTATGDPLIFYFDNESDDVFDPIRESHVDVQVYSLTNFALADLYSVEFLQFKVNIYEDDNLYWTGYIETQKYQEPYEDYPYPVTISCTDGLSVLKDTRYQNEGVDYTARTYESQMILNILGKIEHTSFYEYVNIYDDQMSKSVDDSPYDQTKIDNDCFVDYYCYDVLKELLIKYNAIIRQKDGYFCILRPKELRGSTVYGRYFTGASTKASVTLTPLQYINRDGYASNRVQAPGGVLMIQSPIEKITIIQDYGNRESWINNNNFEGEIYDGNDFEGWTRSANAVATPIGNLIPGESEGVYITPYSTSLENRIFRTFGPDALTSPTDVFKVSFEYLLYNTSALAVTNVEVHARITDDGQTPTFYLQEDDGETCSWVGAETDLCESLIVTAEIGSSGWQTWERKFTSLPVDGPFVISLYAPNIVTPGIYIAFRNLRVYTSSLQTVMENVIIGYIPNDLESYTGWRQLKPRGFKPVGRYMPVKKAITLINHKYEATNSINGDEVDLNYMLGDVTDANIDNIPQQFKGSLAYYPLQVRIDTIHVLGESGTANYTCNGVTKLATFNNSTLQTATDFVTANAAAYDAVDITLTSDGAYLIFTAQDPGVDFTGDTTVEELTGDLTGIVTEQTSSRVSQLHPTSLWSTRAGNESKTLLQLVADEIAEMYSRPKQLIQMPIRETSEALNIDILGNFQDTVNTYNDAVRIFCMNRGEFDVRNREWSIDLFEIGTGAIVNPTTIFTIKYGFLYNWYAATDARNIAASGWNVPTLADCQTLQTYLGGESVAGGKLKETGFTYWHNPNIGATNEVGLNVRGAGYRDSQTGDYKNLMIQSFSWNTNTTTEFNGGYWGVLSNTASLIIANTLRGHGFPIRLVRSATVAEQLLADGTACDDYIGNNGQHYKTVKIGTQVWTAANLCDTKYSDGTNIPLVQGILMWVGTTEGAYCYYENDITNAYEETEVLQGSTTGDSTSVTADNGLITTDTI